MQALDDPTTAAYLGRLTDRAREILGRRLVAAYVINSGARDDYLPGRSDLDVAVVVESDLEPPLKERLADAFRHASLPCPAPRLELVVYRRAVAASPGSRPAFELNLNTGPAIDDHLATDPADEPPYWFVLDLGAAANGAVALFGPSGSEVFGRARDEDTRGALRAARVWHARHDTVAPNRVLNDCRAWRWVATDDWSSKTEAAAWAIVEGADADLVNHALDLRRGVRSDPLAQEGVESLARRVTEAIDARRASAR